MCLFCRHYNRDDSERMTCKAFPGGIPEAIYESRHDHREPYRSDRGIRFDPVDQDAADYADELFPRGGGHRQ
jgi:hypothetical protein